MADNYAFYVNYYSPLSASEEEEWESPIGHNPYSRQSGQLEPGDFRHNGPAQWDNNF